MGLRNSAMVMCAGLALSFGAGLAHGQVKEAPPVKVAPAQPVPAVKPMPAAATPPAPIDPSKPQPQINFDKISNDFGIINDDNPVSTEFKFTNKGAGNLNISNVQGSCGCTVPALDKKDYAPGESGSIKVTYNPHGRRGKQQTNVTVTSNDPAKPTQILELHSEIKPLMMMDPMVANFGQAQKGKPSTVTVLISSRQKDLTPTQATSSSPSIVTKLLESKPATVDGEAVTQTALELSTAPNAEVGQVSGQVTIRTSDPARLLYLSVMGEVVGDVNPQPARVQLSALEPGSAMSATVRLTSRTNKPFKIEKGEDAAAGPKLFNVAVAEDTTVTPSAWNITLTGAAPQTGAFRGDIVLTTNIEDEKTVKIPYYGFIRNPQPNQPGGFGGVDPWTANPSLMAR